MNIFKHIMLVGVVFFNIALSCNFAQAGIEKELKAQVKISINWNIDEADSIKKGSFSFYLKGKLRLNEKFASTDQLEPAMAAFIPYSFKQVNASVNYKNIVIDKKPPKGCPEVKSERSYSGPVSVKTDLEPGALLIFYLGSMLEQVKQNLDQTFMGGMSKSMIPAEAENKMDDYYLFGLPVESMHATGKRRIDLNGGQCKYIPTKQDINIGLTLEKILVNKKGILSGKKTWHSDILSLSPKLIGIKGKKTPVPAWPAEKQNGSVKYNVKWTFGEQLPPKIKPASIAFNTETNKDQKIVLTLKELSSEKDISPPEWIRDKKNKPAALVLGNKFKVKAVFEADKNIKKVEIWAEEEVVKGDGGFGGIEKKIVNVENGKISAEFDIKTPQNVIGINEIKWIWRAKDMTPGKEPVELLAGQTQHKIFIIGPSLGNTVLDIPFINYNKYVYIVKNGCKWAAGTKGGRETFDTIWGQFWDIPGPAGNILRYVHKGADIYDTSGLLKAGKGRCGAWSDFFYDTVACQGILIRKICIQPKAPYTLLIVKKMPGQGNLAPYRGFYEHVFTAYNHKYYDPSYHTETIADLYAYEQRSFIAYCDLDAVDEKQSCAEYFTDDIDGFIDCLVNNADDCAPNNVRVCEIKKGCDDKNK